MMTMTTIQDLLDAAPPPAVLAKATLMLMDGEIAGREWNQASYGEVAECGTSCCVAGNVALELGAHPTAWGKFHILETVASKPGVHNNDDLGPDTMASCGEFARNALGLSAAESCWLFEAYRTESEVRYALTAITEGRTVQEAMDELDEANWETT